MTFLARLFSLRRSPVRRHFQRSDLDRIRESVRAAESKTSGEIRVKIIPQCDPDVGGDVAVQAVREFAREGMERTRDRTGVLILLALEERKFQILADAGIHAKVPDAEWRRMAGAMSAVFREGRFTEGVCEAVAAVGERLAEHFPRRPDDENELPDRVITA
jgi:uncharacterized membrane protein